LLGKRAGAGKGIFVALAGVEWAGWALGLMRLRLAISVAGTGLGRRAVALKEVAMFETVIGLFPEREQAEEVNSMLTNRGYSRRDVEVIDGSALGDGGMDLLGKLSELGLADEAQKEKFIDGMSRGGRVLAARAPDQRRAEQVVEIMEDHGAMQCAHIPDTGWTSAQA
jgi:hypothetical protein